MQQGKSLLITLISFMILYSCGEQQSAPMRLGTTLWPGYEPLYLAQELENWSADTIKLVEYPSSSDVMRAFRNQSLEAASLTLDEVIKIWKLGIPAVVVLVHDISDGADVIIARPDINSMQGLRGKRVGVESDALGAYVITRALEETGLAPADIEIVDLPVNEHETAFMQGDVDAIVTFEPTRTRLLNTDAREIFTSREIPNEIVDVLVVNQTFMEKSPEVVKTLIDGWFLALDYMQTDQAEAMARFSERLRISPQQVSVSYNGLILPDRAMNHQLLGGEAPELQTTIEKLSRIKKEKQLILDTSDIMSLFTDKFIGSATR